LWQQRQRRCTCGACGEVNHVVWTVPESPSKIKKKKEG
jgi:hypothetical protein